MLSMKLLLLASFMPETIAAEHCITNEPTKPRNNWSQYSTKVRNTRGPIPYTPYEMTKFPIVDFKNGTVVDEGVVADSIIEVPVADNQSSSSYPFITKQVNACDYFSMINGFEKLLADQGFSLKSGPELIEAQKTVLPRKHKQIWRYQVSKFESGTRTGAKYFSNFKKVKNESDSLYEDLSGVNGSEEARKRIERKDILLAQYAQNVDSDGMVRFVDNYGVKKPLTNIIRKVPCMDMDFGWKDAFKVEGNCKLDFFVWDDRAPLTYKESSNKRISYPTDPRLRPDGSVGMNGETNIKVGLFGLKKVKVFKANADGYSKHGAKKVHAKIHAKVAGISVVKFGPNEEQSIFLKQTKNPVEVDHGVDLKTIAGIIPMKLRVGMRGGVGTDYGLALAGTEVGYHLIPNLNLRGYIEVKTTAIVAGLGSGGELTLAKQNLDNGLIAKLQWAEQLGIPQVENGLNVDTSVNFMNGELYAFAYLYTPKRVRKWPFFRKNEYRYQFFDWQGYQAKRNILYVKLNRRDLIKR